MKTVWLIRHGLSKAQTGEGGGMDPDLAERGEKQADRLAPVLENESFDAVFISPLQRARKTFERSGLGAERIVFDSRLVECNYGYSYRELLPYTTPDYGFEDQHNAWDNPVGARLKQFVRDLRGTKGDRFAIFGHWAYFNLFGRHVLGAQELSDPLRTETKHSLFLDNAAICRIGLDYERYGDVILQWNIRDHLSGLLDESNCL